MRSFKPAKLEEKARDNHQVIIKAQANTSLSFFVVSWPDLF